MSGLTGGGIVLALLGVLGFAIPIFTTRQTEDVARVGDVKLQTTVDKTYDIPAIASGGALLLGVVLIGVGLSRRR